MWPWTPDEKLETYTVPVMSDSNHVGSRLADRPNAIDVVCHLDLQ